MVDGILIPTWNWRLLDKTNLSGKHNKAGFNYQFIFTLKGKLLAITDPVSGETWCEFFQALWFDPVAEFIDLY